MANPMGPAQNEKSRITEQSFTVAAEKSKEVAGQVMDKARDAAASVAHKAEEAAAYLGHKAEDATSAVGSGMTSLGHTLREKTDPGGMVGQASSAVATTLESGGRYLQQEGLRGMAEDVTNLVRRNPIPALFIGAGIGFLLARATSKRS